MASKAGFDATDQLRLFTTLLAAAGARIRATN